MIWLFGVKKIMIKTAKKVNFIQIRIKIQKDFTQQEASKKKIKKQSFEIC